MIPNVLSALAIPSQNAQSFAAMLPVTKAPTETAVAATSTARLAAPRAKAMVRPTGGRIMKLTTAKTAPRATPSQDRQSALGFSGLGGTYGASVLCRMP